MSSPNWKPWMTFTVIAVMATAAGLAGCASEKSKKAPVDQVTGRAKGQPPAGPAKPGTDTPPPGGSTPPDGGSPAYVLTPAESQMETLLKVMEEGHRLHHQTWMKFWGDDQSVGSVFKSVEQVLVRHRGQWPWKLESRECPGPFSQMTWEKEASDNELTALLKSVEIKAVNCSGNEEGKRLASVQWETGKMKIKFSRATIGEEGVGSGLAKIEKDVSCEVTLNEERKVQTLTCEGLGQDRTRDPLAYAEFTFFKFDRSTEKMVQIRGSKFDAEGKETEKIDQLVPIVE